MRRKRSTLLLARFLAARGNLDAWHHTWQICSHGLGRFHTSFHGSKILPAEHSSTKSAVCPGRKAVWMSCFSDIRHCTLAYVDSSSQDPHRKGVTLDHNGGFVVRHTLSSHSRNSDGLILALGHGRFFRGRSRRPCPACVVCVGGCSIRMDVASISSMRLRSPHSTTMKDRRHGAYLRQM